MPKKIVNLDLAKQELELLESDDKTDVEEDDDEIQAPVKQRVYREVKPDDKRKKGLHVRTEAQQKGWEKAIAVREANRIKRLEEKMKAEEEHKKKMEEIVVKKAIAVKKREIKKQAVLEEIEDDSTPIEEVKKIVRKPVKPVVYQEPISNSLSFQFI